MAGVAILLAASVAVFALGFVEDSGGSSPTADFDAEVGGDNLVNITHGGGDTIPIENVEILVRVEGQPRAKLVNLPTDSGDRFTSANIEGNEALIAGSFGASRGVLDDDNDNRWSAGGVAGFTINSGPLTGDETVTLLVLDAAENAVIGEAELRLGG